MHGIFWDSFELSRLDHSFHSSYLCILKTIGLRSQFKQINILILKNIEQGGTQIHQKLRSNFVP